MITVGIPTYNRADSLAETIEAICNVNPPTGQWELIVVDNNSSDATKEVCKKHLPPNGRYVFEPRPGVSHARNRVLDEAKGDLVVFTDDDTSPSEDWLVAYEKIANEHPDCDFFMGPTEWDWLARRPWWFKEDKGHSIEFCYRRDLGPHDKPIPDNVCPAGPNMAIRREAYLRYGGFHPELGIMGGIKVGGEEPDMIRRYRANGLHGYYVAAAAISHKVVPSLVTFRSRAEGMLATGFSNSLLEDIHHTGPRFLGMPRWWLLRIIQGPFVNVSHVLYHGVKLQSTPVVYHLLRLIYWIGQVRYLFMGGGIGRRLKRTIPVQE